MKKDTTSFNKDKRKYLPSFYWFASFIFFTLQSGWGQNLFTNSDLETGNNTGWTWLNIANIVSPGYSSTYCIRTSTSNDGAFQNINVLPSTAYTYTLYGKNSGTNISVWMYAKDKTNGASVLAEAYFTDPGWTQKTLTFTTASNTSQVEIGVWGWDNGGGSGYGYVDNFSLTAGVATVVNVTSISLTPTATSIVAGCTQDLYATVLPANATDKTVNWNSSNTSIATVSTSGLVTAVAPGNATITATTTDGAKTATCAVIITALIINPPSPAAPTSLISSFVTTNGFSLSWTSSIDNVSVAKYLVYIDGVLYDSIANTTIVEGPVVKYNRTVSSTTYTSSADTYYSAWGADGVLYSTVCDAMGFNNDLNNYAYSNGTPGRNLSVVTLTNYPWNNNFVGNKIDGNHQALGIFAGSNDGDVTLPHAGCWKASGLGSYNSVLYLTVNDQMRFSDNTVGSTIACILKSTDGGINWRNPAPDSTLNIRPVTYMFTDSRFTRISFVQYGQDGTSSDNANSSGTYAYAISNDGHWDNGNALYLGRILKSRLAFNMASDWEFYKGMNGTLPQWGTLAEMVPIFTKIGKISQTHMQYVPSIKKYILPNWYYVRPVGMSAFSADYYGAASSHHTKWEFFAADNPWGPWNSDCPFYVREWFTEGYYNPAVANKFSSADSIGMLYAGDYYSQSGLDALYSLHYSKLQIKVGQSTNMNIAGLTSGKTYSITIKSKDVTGKISGASDPLSVKTLGTTDTQAPTVPTNLTSSSIAQTSFTLSWTASTDNVGVTSYEVFRGTVSCGSTASTSLNVTGLTSNTTYAMTVKAKDAAGNVSAASTVLNVTTAKAVDTQAPTAPTGLVSSAISQTSFTLSWTASTDNVAVVSYEVFRGTTSCGTTASTTLNLTGLSANTKYAMTVKASDAKGNVSAASTALNVTTASMGIDENNNHITIFPNPVINILNITNLDKESVISIYTVNGNLLTQKIAVSDAMEINVSELSAGVYIIKINNGVNSVIKKFVKE